MAATDVTRRRSSRPTARLLASAGFLVMIVGVTYFGALVLAVHWGGEENRAAAFRELGLFLSGGQEWYRDARVYGAVSLLLALVSLLSGLHPLARITLPVAGAAFLLLYFAGDPIRDLLLRWAHG